MKIRAVPFSPAQAAVWDELVQKSPCGTFLHSRRFLSYHGDRYRDLSVCLYDRDSLTAVFPAAAEPADSACVCSHPGATYGGVVHGGSLRGAATIEALRALLDYYRALGFTRLRYKAVPRNFQRIPAEDDLYALFRLRARRYRCELAAVIELQQRPKASRRRRRSLKNAADNGVLVIDNDALLRSYWPLLERTLAHRHNARPVHTLEEMELLKSLFPDRIRLTVALAGEELLGGVVLFIMPTTVHVQYSCASPRGLAVGAVDAIFEHCISAAAAAGRKWFSMGTSNLADGQILNESLYRFKIEFGAGGVVHESYELDLA